jgi:hypothetical protein
MDSIFRIPPFGWVVIALMVRTMVDRKARTAVAEAVVMYWKLLGPRR